MYSCKVEWMSFILKMDKSHRQDTYLRKIKVLCQEIVYGCLPWNGQDICLRHVLGISFGWPLSKAHFVHKQCYFDLWIAFPNYGLWSNSWGLLSHFPCYAQKPSVKVHKNLITTHTEGTSLMSDFNCIFIYKMLSLTCAKLECL